jgi:putative flippase GtrA
MIIKQSFRFFVTGLINTFFGLSVIYLLLFVGINDYIANASGYFFGVIISFFLNKYYVFKSGAAISDEVSRFITVFVISYLVNILILYVSLDYLDKYTAQFLSMVFYSITNFLLNKFFVFKINEY